MHANLYVWDVDSLTTYQSCVLVPPHHDLTHDGSRVWHYR